jgi:hypothetical protein
MKVTNIMAVKVFMIQTTAYLDQPTVTRKKRFYNIDPLDLDRGERRREIP